MRWGSYRQAAEGTKTVTTTLFVSTNHEMYIQDEKMRVSFLREMMNDKMEEFLRWMMFKKVSENEKKITYEGSFSFSINFDDLAIPRGKRRKFYNSLKVEGGSKALYSGWIEVTPRKSKTVLLRVSKEEFSLLKDYVGAHGTTISSFLRSKITEALGMEKGKTTTRGSSKLYSIVFEAGSAHCQKSVPPCET